MKKKLESLLGGFILSTIFSTIPAIGATLVDRVIHQNLFDNKPLQYGLTAAESILGQSDMFGVLNDDSSSFSQDFKQYFTNLIKMDLSVSSVLIKSIFISGLIQSIGFKYILDSAAEQPEVGETPEENNFDVNQGLVENHF